MLIHNWIGSLSQEANTMEVKPGKFIKLNLMLKT